MQTQKRRAVIFVIVFALSFAGPSVYGDILIVHPNADCIGTDPNCIDFDPTDIGLDPNTQSFNTIQGAINDANHFDTIIVFPGTYYEHIDFYGKALEVMSVDLIGDQIDPNTDGPAASSEPNEIVIAGKALKLTKPEGLRDIDDPNAYTHIIDGEGFGAVVSFRTGESSDAALIGFVIQNGKHGIECQDVLTAPCIEDCVIWANLSHGIHVIQGCPSVMNCLINLNFGSGVSAVGAKPYILDCDIVDNEGHGLVGGLAELRDSVITNNKGWGTRNWAGPIIKCVIKQNGQGGVCYQDAPFTSRMRNCIVAGNLAAGVYASHYGGMIFITNCTIVANKASGVHVHQNGAHMFVSNSIISFNSGYGLHKYRSPLLQSDHNNICLNEEGPCLGLALGRHDIVERTWFVELPYWDRDGVWHDGDCHLMSTAGRWDSVAQEWVVDPIDSPCIDAATADPYYYKYFGIEPGEVIASEPMPNGSRINIGAYGGTDEASMSNGI